MRERLQQAGGPGVLVYSAVCNALLNSYSGVSLYLVNGTRLKISQRNLDIWASNSRILNKCTSRFTRSM